MKNMSVLLLVLGCIFLGQKAEGSGTAFLDSELVHSSNSHEFVMNEFGDFSTLKSRTFLEEIRKNHFLETLSQVRNLLSSDRVHTALCSTIEEEVQIARINSFGVVGYFSRPWEPGEKCVFVDDIPIYSTRCGNPIRTNRRLPPIAVVPPPIVVEKTVPVEPTCYVVNQGTMIRPIIGGVGFDSLNSTMSIANLGYNNYRSFYGSNFDSYISESKSVLVCPPVPSQP